MHRGKALDPLVAGQGSTPKRGLQKITKIVITAHSHCSVWS